MCSKDAIETYPSLNDRRCLLSCFLCASTFLFISFSNKKNTYHSRIRWMGEFGFSGKLKILCWKSKKKTRKNLPTQKTAMYGKHRRGISTRLPLDKVTAVVATLSFFSLLIFLFCFLFATDYIIQPNYSQFSSKQIRS